MWDLLEAAHVAGRIAGLCSSCACAPVCCGEELSYRHQAVEQCAVLQWSSMFFFVSSVVDSVVGSGFANLPKADVVPLHALHGY